MSLLTLLLKTAAQPSQWTHLFLNPRQTSLTCLIIVLCLIILALSLVFMELYSIVLHFCAWFVFFSFFFSFFSFPRPFFFLAWIDFFLTSRTWRSKEKLFCLFYFCNTSLPFTFLLTVDIVVIEYLVFAQSHNASVIYILTCLCMSWHTYCYC